MMGPCGEVHPQPELPDASRSRTDPPRTPPLPLASYIDHGSIAACSPGATRIFILYKPVASDKECDWRGVGTIP